MDIRASKDGNGAELVGAIAALSGIELVPAAAARVAKTLARLEAVLIVSAFDGTKSGQPPTRPAQGARNE